MSSPFDAFAWFYDRYWAAPFEQWQRPALQRLLFPSITPGTRVLDLCCGTGTLAAQLVARGYEVIGVDSSDGMLQIAREKVPEAKFIHAEASSFALPNRVDAAVCMFDSLNNVMEPEQMRGVFQCVDAALEPGGTFVFDVNTRAAYGERWDHTFSEVQPDHAFFLRGGFDQQAIVGYTKITMFRFFESWQRSDVEIRQRPWEISEIEPLLRGAGFDEICAYHALEDLAMSGHYGTGRVYFKASQS